MSTVGRFLFGGSLADFAVTVSGSSLQVGAGSAMTLWTAQTGGTQVTDLLAADGVTVITSITSNSLGLFPQFYGPVGTSVLWGDCGATIGGVPQRRKVFPDGTTTYVPLQGQPSGITLTDGQLLAYSAASGGLVAANPQGILSAGNAINNSGTATSCPTNTTTDIASTTYAYSPNGSRELWVGGSTIISPATSTNSFVGLSVAEVSNGVDTPLTFSAVLPSGSQTVGVTTQVAPTRVGAIARTRTFKLQVILPAAITSGATTLNSAQYPSILRGEWR